MSARPLQWHLLSPDPALLPWQENQVASVECRGKQICVARYRDSYYAFAATCPHAGGRFSEGWIDALGNIVCPLHRYRFALTNGRNTSGEGYYLKTYPLELRPDGLYIGFPETSLFGI
jgi:3-phenylpropionate/trans-cinnamate dioxygenase ferredoxin subunit